MNTIIDMSKQYFKLSFPKPELGIHDCSWIIEANDGPEAVGKFAHYLIELKKGFTFQPLPIGKSTNPGNVTHEFVRRLSQITDPLGFIVTLHVFVEHCLNHILLKFCPNRDLTRYDFFKKLEFVYCIEKIPKNLYVNLSKLNDLRVKVAHDPDYDLTTMDLNYLDCPAGFALSQYKPSYDGNAKHNHIFNVLNIIMAVTYISLHDHCMTELQFGTKKWKITPLPLVAAAESD